MSGETLENIAILAAVILAPIVLVWIIVHRVRKELKPGNTWFGWAKGREWTYTKKNPTLTKRWRGGPFTGEGDAYHAVVGMHRNRQVLIFNYNHWTEGGSLDSLDLAKYTVVAVTLPARRPDLEVEPTRSRPGRQHSLSEAFAAMFWVSTSHDRFAQDVLHQGMMEWLVKDPRAERFPIRFEGSEVISWTDDHVEPDEAMEIADFLIDVLDRVPPHVWGR